jgi:hypothetical protein
VRPDSGRPPGARAARRVLLAVTSAALAAGVMAGTTSTATASITRPATSTAAPLSGTPPFFAGIVAVKNNGQFASVVRIFSSATGAPAATIEVPGSQNLLALSRLGDDQTFLVSSFDQTACISHLWTFAIDAAGKPGPLTPLPVPQLSGNVEELASSADGKVVAFNLFGCTDGLQLGVIHLATSQVTQWHNPGIGGEPSLTADGSVVSFTLNQNFDDPAAPPQAWTMPTDAPAGPLLDHAHQVPGLGANAERAVLSPSGDQLWIETQDPAGQTPVNLSLITTSTGALVRPVVPLGDGGLVLALDAAGQHMLAYGGNPGPGHADAEEIDLSTGQTLTLTITDPVIEGALTTFAW